MKRTNGFAIEFDSVCKLYRLQVHRTLKELVPAAIKKREARKELWALKNVSFKIKRGEAIGIVGPNGAGKSTILKLIAGVTRQDKGKIVVNGRVSPLIELGAGFHPDLTGAENIYLNGSILGLTKKEIDEKFTEIVDFAELWDFITQPVKRYSSGMYARLGFAIAVNTDADILLVDEVLAVGDRAFQAKCLSKFHHLRSLGKTIILVSHSMDLILNFCDRGIFLNKGKATEISSVEKTILDYEKFFYKKERLKEMGEGKDKEGHPDGFEQWGSGEVLIKNVQLLDHRNNEVKLIRSGELLRVGINYRVVKKIATLKFSLGIYREDGVYVSGLGTDFDGFRIKTNKKSGNVSLSFPELSLNAGKYYLRIAAYGNDEASPYHFLHRAKELEVRSLLFSRGVVLEKHQWQQKT